MDNTAELEAQFRASIEKKLRVKIPEQEDFNLTPATRLLEKRREMQEVENDMAKQKEEFQSRMETLEQRREDVKRKETQLKESLMRFDKFLKENEAKRVKAIKKAAEEKRLREMKEIEVLKLQEMADELVARKEKQAKLLLTNAQYQKYLEGVIEYASEFPEVKDLISRYDTLVATSKDLMDRAKECQDLTEHQRAEFANTVQERNNKNLNYNNELARLQTKFEEMQQRTVKLQADWDRIVATSSQKSLLLGQIKIATNNLYSLVKLRLSNLTPTNDTLVQLDRIEQFVKDLSDITERIKYAQLKAEITNNNAAPSTAPAPATPGSVVNLLTSKRATAATKTSKGSSPMLSSQVQTPQTRDISTASTTSSKMASSVHA